MTGITNPTEEYFKDGTWGWDGTQWRKLGILFGYYDRLVGQVVNDNASPGDNTLTSDNVPDGELWVVQICCASDINSNVTRIYIQANSPTIPCIIAEEYSVAAAHWVISSREIVLKPGDCLSCKFFGCTAGDDLYLRYWGYKVRVS